MVSRINNMQGTCDYSEVLCVSWSSQVSYLSWPLEIFETIEGSSNTRACKAKPRTTYVDFLGKRRYNLGHERVCIPVSSLEIILA